MNELGQRWIEIGLKIAKISKQKEFRNFIKQMEKIAIKFKNDITNSRYTGGKNKASGTSSKGLGQVT